MSRTPPRAAEQVSYRRLFAVVAALNLLAAVWVVWDEAATRRPWKHDQDRFNRLLADRGKPAEPVRIRQVTNPELGVVDRCQTCHLGIDRDDLGDDVPREFRVHPDRDRLLGNHPVERFGCTICHRGQGAQTKGVAGRRFDHGRDDHYWDTPMLSTVFAESACVGCHDRAGDIPGADAFNRGRRLFAELRCSGCHDARWTIAGPEAPPLDQVAGKTSAAWVAAWLRDPPAFRPRTVMPSFWPEPLGSDGDPLPAADPGRVVWQATRDREIAAIVAYLATVQPAAPLPEAAPPDDAEAAARGQQLFDTVGCRGCHAAGDRGGGWQSTFAPDLSRIGEKASPRWLAAWLAGPAALWPNTRMPDLRLSPAERGDLVAYLGTLRQPGAAAFDAAWPPADPALAATGRQLIQKYGCYGCHTIPGLETAGRAGPDLTSFGDKPPDMLAWGDARIDCSSPALECWTLAKLERPRWMHSARIDLVMPSPRLDRRDAEALSVFLMAQRSSTIPPAYRAAVDEQTDALDRGERLIAHFNCRGCHEIGRTERPRFDEDGEPDGIEYIPDGGDIRALYEQSWDAPPPLTFAGKKFQYDWLYRWLGDPTPSRPWLAIRMARFGLTPADRETLGRYFAARNQQPYPFVPDRPAQIAAADVPAAAAMFRDFQCYRCHQISGASGLQPGELAPDLAQVPRRMRPDWVRAWLLDPQPLMPGTKMPTYFPVEDEDQPDVRVTPCPACFGGDIPAQIDAITAVLWQLPGGIDLKASAAPAAPPR